MTRLPLAAPLAILLAACAIIPRGTGPQDLFWERLQALCGRAFPGRVVSNDPGDSQLAAARLVLHVARCGPETVRIAFHASADASRVPAKGGAPRPAPTRPTGASRALITIS